MPKPKANTDYTTGNSAIFRAIIDKFFQNNPPPPLWGVERQPWQRAMFLAAAAASPGYLDSEHLLVGVADKRESFIGLYQTDPDYFLKFVGFVRGQMNVISYVDMAKGFLREGAVARFKEKTNREPTDKELSAMIKEERGVDVSAEYFGDGRRLAKLEDRRIAEKLSTLERVDDDVF